MSEHLDVLIVGAGISGIGAACHLQDKQPGQDLRDPRGARGDRRHLGPVPLPRHPLGLRPAHLRLRVQAVDEREGDRRRPVDPRLHPRDGERERHRPPHPLPPPGRRAPSGRAPTARWTVEVERADAGETVDADRRLAVLRQRLLPLRRGLHAAASRASSASPARSCTRSTGPRTSTTPASASSSSAAAPPRSPSCPAMAEQRRARDDAAALADLRPAGARARTRSPTLLRRVVGDERAYAITRRKNIVHAARDLRLCRRFPQAAAPAHPLGQRAAAAGGLRRRQALQPDATTRGTSACAPCPTATCSRRSAPGNASVVTDRIETFTETRHPAGVRRASSRPTSSSPRPA